MGSSNSTYAVDSAAFGSEAEPLRLRIAILLAADRAGDGSVLADGLAAEEWPVVCLNLPSRSRARDLRGLIFGWKDLVRAIPAFDQVHIRCESARALARQAAPAVVLARFFGKTISVQLTAPDVEETIAKHGRWLLPVLRLADLLIVGSRYLERSLARTGLPVRRMVDPVAIDSITHNTRSRLQPRILIDTPLQPGHNARGAIRAFRLVKQKYPRAEMVFVGSGPERYRLMRIVREQRISGVEFMESSEISDFDKLLAECDVYLNPSLVEESPDGVVRAFAAGLPVVCSDADGMLHMVRDSVSGLMAPLGDHVALADAIIELIENEELTAKLSRRGRAEARKYSWSRVRQDWVNLYRSLARTRDKSNS